MKTAVITLAIAVILTSSLAMASHLDGWHSTPSMWLAFVNLPGVLCLVLNEGWMGFMAATLVNWAIYALIAKVVVFLRHDKRLA
jgi:hypothetical protein